MLLEILLGVKRIVIIGDRFIGVELANKSSSIKGIDFSIVETLDYCLAANFDEEFFGGRR